MIVRKAALILQIIGMKTNRSGQHSASPHSNAFAIFETGKDGNDLRFQLANWSTPRADASGNDGKR